MKYFAIGLDNDKTICGATIEVDNEIEANKLLACGWEEIDYDLYMAISIDASIIQTDHRMTTEELQEENKLLKAQLQAQVDRSDFIEDCIAEMAVQVYGGV